MVNANKYTKTGFWTALLAAICCFTPLLAAILSVTGLTALLAYADFVLLPAFGLGIILLLYGIYHRKT